MSFGPKSEGVLYHYTGHNNLHCIVEKRCLWMSHVYYLNDASEIKYGAELFKTVVVERQNQGGDSAQVEFLGELRDWTNELINVPHYIFVFSLTEKGDLLSQWRAYTPSGSAGVSIGFSKVELAARAGKMGYVLIRCVYDRKEQLDTLNATLDEILSEFVTDRTSLNTVGRPLNQKYLPYLSKHTERLLKVFCRLKNPSFQEESEWRLVSKYYESYQSQEIRFRQGKTTLIPYIEFDLSGMQEDGGLFEQVYVGPSQNFNLAYAAVGNFLSNKKACKITMPSQSPLRDL